MALTDKLTAIGDAIREKTGKSELMTLDEMPTEIAAITTGGGGELPEEALIITGDCGYRFANGGWNWFLDEYGNQITTKDITSLSNMFTGSRNLTSILFDINCKDYTGMPTNSVSYANDLTSMFTNCTNLIEAPKIIKPTIINLQNIFDNCVMLRDIPDDYCDTWRSDFIDAQTSAYTGNASSIFRQCYSLRSYPKKIHTFVNKNINSGYNTIYQNMFYNCFVLDEITDIPLPYTSTFTSNVFSNTFFGCSRAKRVTFATQEDGTPYTMNWKSQILDFTNRVGWCPWGSRTNITDYNSGITEATMVTDDASYQALKDNPDWWDYSADYSRYNHDSAVETINSLPDTSEYLASAGGTNTIKYIGSVGAKTDGGAINTLTEAEIAVATAKGWTVALQ